MPSKNSQRRGHVQKDGRKDFKGGLVKLTATAKETTSRHFVACYRQDSVVHCLTANELRGGGAEHSRKHIISKESTADPHVCIFKGSRTRDVASAKWYLAD